MLVKKHSKLGIRNFTLTKCPAGCNGGLTTDPLLPTKFVHCQLCYGLGWVISNAKCRCGKPLMPFGDGVIDDEKQLFCCGAQFCKNMMRPVAQYKPQNDSDDDEDAFRMFGHFCD